MTPTEFHDACYAACYECPQFRGYDEDEDTEFVNLPKKGMFAVVKFWRTNEILWEHGYYQALPEECQELFDKIDELLDQAIRDALK